MFRTHALVLSTLVSVLVASPSSEGGVVIPDDLQPGDTYHLAFVTVSIRDALSSDIADYNQFVNDQAALSCLTGADMGVEWFAIASTATVNARDNAVVGFTSPVYLLDGATRIADGKGDLWNGAIANPLSLDQFLGTSASVPWTGTAPNGIATIRPLGSVNNTTTVGNTGFVNVASWWIAFDSFPSSGLSTLYALSAELTVPAVVCPGTIGGLTSPANGTEDARQPYEPQDNVADPALRQGIGSTDEPIVIDIGAGNTAVSADCFSFCETSQDANLGNNGIASIVDNCDGTYDIVLDFAIAPGAWTTISYLDGSTASYLAHPANVNGDSFGNANDILGLIDMLNGVVEPTFGLFSTDIDHSGAFTAADILRVIDLLNGAGSYIEWLGVPKPINTCG